MNKQHTWTEVELDSTSICAVHISVYIITLIDFMEITVVHISYACTGDENQVSLLH